LVALGEAWNANLVGYPCPTAPFKEVYKAHAGVGGDRNKFYGYIESHQADFAKCQKVLCGIVTYCIFVEIYREQDCKRSEMKRVVA
jgi:hypothetical protein